MVMDDRRGNGASRPSRHGVSPERQNLASFFVSRRAALAAFGAVLVTLLVFRLFPGLDLAVAAPFYDGHNHFIGQTTAGEALRRAFSLMPFLVAGLMLGLYGLQRLGPWRHWAPSGRGLVFLLASLALGPGLLVNVVLKDHSHRPRPVQTDIFGGTMAFRPVGTFDGACASNCSFVSGEGASAFWTAAPALLLPAASQPAALIGALCLGVAASLLRIAFGGHYLSDTIMAALLVWLVVAGTWGLVMRQPPRLF